MSENKKTGFVMLFRIVMIILFIISNILIFFTDWGIPGLQKYGELAEYLDMNIHYTADFVYSMLDEIGYLGILAHIRINFIDFLSMLSFFVIQIMIIKKMFKNTEKNNLYKISLTSIYIRIASDILENILLITVLINYPNKMTTIVTIAAIITTIKFISLISWIVALVVEILKKRKIKN